MDLPHRGDQRHHPFSRPHVLVMARTGDIGVILAVVIPL